MAYTFVYEPHFLATPRANRTHIGNCIEPCYAISEFSISFICFIVTFLTENLLLIKLAEINTGTNIVYNLKSLFL